MRRAHLVGAVYVTAPGALVLLSAHADSGAAYLVALVLALPLSVLANVASFAVAALVLPSTDSDGAPIAAAFMSGAAGAQLLAVRVVLRRRTAGGRQVSPPRSPPGGLERGRDQP